MPFAFHMRFLLRRVARYCADNHGWADEFLSTLSLFDQATVAPRDLLL